MTRHVKAFGLGLALAAMLVGAPLLSSSAGAASITLQPPAIPGVAAVPGAVLDPATASSSMGLLKVTPAEATAGTPITISGSGLSANQTIRLSWSTANATWVLDPEPGTVNYLGRSATKYSVVLDSTTTDASGSFTVTVKAPEDWGGVHDIYAVIGGVEVAHGGFVERRSLTISPSSGPIGTPITITYRGLGASLYEGGAALLYDNHFAGEMMANWTRGTAVAVISASGPVGPHIITVGDAISYLYMNIAQSPLPYATGSTFRFTVTKDNGPAKPEVNWPVNVTPTVSAETTLQTSSLATNSGATATLGVARGPVNRTVKLTAVGLKANIPVQLRWSTVQGSRVNCTGTCWEFVSSPLGSAKPSGTSLRTKFEVPDGLGGWHVVQLLQSGQVEAQVPFYVEESVVGTGVSSPVVKEGAPFSIHLKGVGWTQVDNTVAVDYDNSYIGYGCGFNSNGDVVLRLHATGAPGTHLIDIYPMLYTQQPSFANTPYGMVPILTYTRDDPALALGYRLPALRFAITVVR